MNSRTAKANGNRGIALPALLCVLMGFASVSAFAAFEDLGAGARGPGMGNAMAAVADDVYAAHYNPAGLGVMTRPQFAASYSQYFLGLTDNSDLGTSFLGYAQPINDGTRGTVAAALNSFSLNGGLYKENTFYLAYGRRVYAPRDGSELFLGTTLKYLSSSFGNFAESANATNGVMSTGQADPLLNGGSSRAAFDADAGLLYSFLTHYQLGLQVQHLARPNMAFGAGDSDRLPRDIKLGFDYKSLISNLVAQVETKKGPGGGADNRYTVAAERWFPKTFVGDFGVRGALGIGSRDYKQVSLGLSYRSRRMQLDYGYSIPLGTISSTSGSHRVALTFHFGKASEQEETLEMLMETLRNIKAPAPAPLPVVEKATVTVYAVPELSETELLIAARLTKADAAIKAGRYREAVSLSSSVVQMAPETAAAWQNMGIGYLGLKNYKKSLNAWNKAYDYEKSAALKEAIKGYIKSISRLARDEAKAQEAAGKHVMSQAELDDLLDRGVDYYVNHELDKAREIFDKVLQAEPDNVEALKALRRLNEEKGN